jgi:hypothetical protein
MAIYLELIGVRTRIVALDAAAKNTLSAEHYELFAAIISLTKSAAKQRDKLAHWKWELSDDLPDALLLTDPRVVLPEYTRILSKGISYWMENKKNWIPRIDPSNIFVYKETDFIELDSEIVSIGGIIAMFVVMIFAKEKPQVQHEIYLAISQEPRILEYVSRQRQAKKNDSSVPEPPPSEERDGSGI